MLSSTADIALERRILAQLESLSHCKTNFQKRIEASRLRWLIAQRSVAQAKRP